MTKFLANDAAAGLLHWSMFQQAVSALPLVSVDWVLTNLAGELLVGQRLNAPARSTWFTPGGRIRKGEALAQALSRVAQDELGATPELAITLMQRGQLMGAWDHFYSDAAFSDAVSTHYVNLPHWATLTTEEVNALRLPLGEQHGEWKWMPLAEAAHTVHPWVQPYVDWVRTRVRTKEPPPLPSPDGEAADSSLKCNTLHHSYRLMSNSTQEDIASSSATLELARYANALNRKSN